MNANSSSGAPAPTWPRDDLAWPGSPSGDGGGSGSGESPDAMMERFVDAVVDKLEQRVVEELERRGRRQSWTAF